MEKNNIDQQQMLSRKELLQLAEIHEPNCVSIFVPTHRAGQEVIQGKDSLILKNQLKEVKSKLEEKGMSPREITSFTQPIEDLVIDHEFWKHQSDGLAIFLADNLISMYTIPVHFEAYNYVSNQFYIKPLMPLFNGDGMFYLLTLQKDEAKFYEATRHSITEVVVDDLIPSQLEESVGYDYEQKGVQFRTQQGSKGSGSFHGHQDLDSNEKEELKQYFRAIDKGLMKLLHDKQHPPLVLCSLDYYFPIYQEVSSYQNLFSKHVSGNPSDKDLMLLHEEAWNLVEPVYNKTQKEKLNQFRELVRTDKASADITELFKAAFEGKIDTLFLENKADIFGTYDMATQEVSIDDDLNQANVSLLNLLTTTVLEKDGVIYLIEKENMPTQSSKVCGLFRY